jgi:hypothetical protein
MASLDEILVASCRCEGFPERVRPLAVKRRILLDHGGSYAPHPSLYIFDNSIQGTMERSAIGRKGSREPYYFEAVGHGLYRITPKGQARLDVLTGWQDRQRAEQERKRQEAEQRSFLMGRTKSSNPPDVVEFNGRRFVRDYPGAKRLKQIYGYSCQVCGCTVATFEGIHYDNQGYAEVHHIRPLGSGHDGPDYCGNMLVLCPNHHAAFDLGTMAVDPGTLEIYYLEPDGGLYKKGPLSLHEPDHEFDPECLRYAWELWLRKLSEHNVDRTVVDL